MVSVAKYVFYSIQKVFWQCSLISVRIHVFIVNDQIANTLIANDPDVVRASSVGAAPTTFALSDLTPGFNGKGKDQLQHETRDIYFGICCPLYSRFDSIHMCTYLMKKCYYPLHVC